jgi:hypothetical protein
VHDARDRGRSADCGQASIGLGCGSVPVRASSLGILHKVRQDAKRTILVATPRANRRSGSDRSQPPSCLQAPDAIRDRVAVDAEPRRRLAQAPGPRAQPEASAAAPAGLPPARRGSGRAAPGPGATHRAGSGRSRAEGTPAAATRGQRPAGRRATRPPRASLGPTPPPRDARRAPRTAARPRPAG